MQQAGNGISRRHIKNSSKIAKGHESVKKLKVSNSQKEYQTHEKPQRRNWRASCTLAWAPGALKGGLLHFLTSIVAKHQKIER